MSNFTVHTTKIGGVRKIPVWYVDEAVSITVRKPKRKARLSEMYPQRAILEEARSLRKNANDFIDHDYYEELVEKRKAKDKEIRANPEAHGWQVSSFGVLYRK